MQHLFPNFKNYQYSLKLISTSVFHIEQRTYSLYLSQLLQKLCQQKLLFMVLTTESLLHWFIQYNRNTIYIGAPLNVLVTQEQNQNMLCKGSGFTHTWIVQYIQREQLLRQNLPTKHRNSQAIDSWHSGNRIQYARQIIRFQHFVFSLKSNLKQDNVKLLATSEFDMLTN